MKKSLSQAIALATLVGATAAHAAGGAVAPVVNPDGLGGALLYPIYTVENDNSTLVSVVNTTEKYKAVKVRFVEAKNSAEVLDFHLYMSPKDVWSGTIVPTTAGAKLISNDRSCIAGVTAKDGKFPAAGLNFSTAQIVQDEKVIAEDKRSTAEELAARVRVGHFEVIEMADINEADAVGAKLAAAIDHNTLDANGGIPTDCKVVDSLWSDVNGWNKGGLTDDRTIANTVPAASVLGAGTPLVKPTGGLYGTGAVVNVTGGWSASYDAVALVSNGETFYYEDVQHVRPGSIYPHLGTEVAGGKTVPQDTIFDALIGALSMASIYNDYFIDPAYGAETDLVVTFPTKRFHTFDAVDLDGSTNHYIHGNAPAPFDKVWDDEKKVAPVVFTATFYGKDEQVQNFDAEDLWVSPRPLEQDKFELNYETNVISLNGSNSFGTVGGVSLEIDGVEFNEGWMEITRAAGVPAIGFANIVTKNGVEADGALRNFAQTFKHKTVK